MRSLLSLRSAHRALVLGRGRSIGVRGLVVATLCAVTGALALSSAPALAVETHVFSSSFGSPGSGAGELSSPAGVAINSVTHNVYVADSGNFRIDEFSSTGTFIRAWGWGVADGLPAFETCTLICQAGIPGSGHGQFTTPTFIAVDNSTGPSAGDVYVGDNGDGLVSKFDASGNLISSWGSGGQLDGSTATRGPFGVLTGVTIDSVGTLYVFNDKNRMFKFAQDSSFNVEFEAGPRGAAPVTGIAVDSAGNFFRADGDLEVEEFTAADNETGEVTANVGARGLAVDPSDGGLYVDSSQGILLHYAFAAVGQVKETGGASCAFGVSSGGCPATDSFGSGVLDQGAGVGIDSGHVYVVDAASNQVDVFTPAILADTITETPGPIAKTAALLHGTVNPDGIEVTSCEFEWGAEEGSYPNTVACSPSPGAGSVPVSVAAEITGLAAATTYHFRITATNREGVNHGQDRSFTTPPSVDSLSTGPAEDLTQTGAKLTGSLSPDGSDTHYYFEYGTSESYGSISPALPGTDAGSASESVQAVIALTGLAANTVYHYRLVGVNSFGTTYGQDASLTTDGPPRIDGESSEVKPTERAGQTSATLQAQVNPDGRETTYKFEYGETTSYGTSDPASPVTLGSGEEPLSVPAAELSGLKIGTTYHYRVLASNEYGTVAGADQTFTTLGPALINGESASGVTAVSATLSVQINPLGSDTKAYFQYGAASCSPTSCVDLPLPPGLDLGSAESDQSFDVHLQGLTPSSTYQYRVVVVNATGTVEGIARTFITQATGTEFTQSDGRAWELVSPPNKQGAGIIAVGNEQGSDIQAAANGDGITYTATAPFVPNPAGSRSIETTQVISSRRAPGSWETADITTAHNEGPSGFSAGNSAEYKLFSSDLSLGLIEPAGETPLPPLPAGSEKTIYLREAGGEYRALVTSENVPPGTKFGKGKANRDFKFISASPDLSHVVVDSTTKLTIAPIGSSALYEWSEGRLQIASVLPHRESASASLGYNNEVVRHAISNDGSRLIWSVGSPGKEHLYLRDIVRGETVQVDAAQGRPEPADINVKYRIADGEGSRIFFTSSAHLTADSTSVEGAEDLYEFEITSGAGEPLAGKLADLTVDRNPGESANVQGVIGASEDGSYVYFVANGVLGDAAEKGAKSGHNLYVARYEAGVKAWMQPAFVAALSTGDEPDWVETGGKGSGGMTSRVSPNGHYLAFMSEQSLTGYENRDANSDVPDEEAFLYDANSGSAVCASCDPTGARPIGLHEGKAYEENLVDYAKNWENRWIAGSVPGWTTTNLVHSLYQSRYLSDSGRLFFNSSDALVPADANGKEDVYEYEPVGIGSCQGPGYGQSASVIFSEGIGGCVSLISTGTSTEESAFMDASETGSDVFFLTLSRLSSQDYDNSIDLYNAHECTPSSPCAVTPALVPPPCTTGDACKPAPTPQPALFGAPSSATFSGAGNTVPSTSKPNVTQRQATQAKKLEKALKACRKKPKRKRVACERQARKKFGAGKSRVAKSLSARARR